MAIFKNKTLIRVQQILQSKMQPDRQSRQSQNQTKVTLLLLYSDRQSLNNTVYNLLHCYNLIASFSQEIQSNFSHLKSDIINIETLATVTARIQKDIAFFSHAMDLFVEKLMKDGMKIPSKVEIPQLIKNLKSNHKRLTLFFRKTELFFSPYSPQVSGKDNKNKVRRQLFFQYYQNIYVTSIKKIVIFKERACILQEIFKQLMPGFTLEERLLLYEIACSFHYIKIQVNTLKMFVVAIFEVIIHVEKTLFNKTETDNQKPAKVENTAKPSSPSLYTSFKKKAANIAKIVFNIKITSQKESFQEAQQQEQREPLKQE